jgi:hypothetical protein
MRRKKKIRKPRRRSLPRDAANRRSGAGKHTDKRFRRNQKRRKYNAWEGW